MANQPIISPAVDEVIIPISPMVLNPLYPRVPIITPTTSGGTGGTVGYPIIG